MTGIKILSRALRTSPLPLLLGGMLIGGAFVAGTAGGTSSGADAPSAPRTLVDEYLKLVTAKPVSVDVLRESPPATLPYARVRLIVAESLDGPMLRGIDAHLFRNADRVSLIEMPLPAGLFRDRIDKTLRASAACSTSPRDDGFRTVDVWCANTGVAGTYHPLIVKVWDDDDPDPSGRQPAPRKVLGRLCHADARFVAECQAAFDYQPTIFAAAMDELSFASDTPERMAVALSRRRELVEAASRNANAAGEVRMVPIPGGMSIELPALGSLPAELCRHEGTVSRIEGDRAYLGLADGASEGSCLFSFKTPFPIGGAALRATFETLDRSSSIDVEASTDESAGRSWKPVFRVGDRPMRQRDEWILPAALSGGNRLHVRVRMKSAAGNVGSEGPRACKHRLDVPISHRLVEEAGVLRLVDLPAPMSYASATRPALQIVVQRAPIPAADLVDMLHQDGRDRDRRAMIDVYAACELDAAACSAIADHAGAIRFWAPAPWQQSPPACLDLLVSRTGSVVFPRLMQITEPLATVVGGGGKSFAFPAVKTADAVVLGLLAHCTGELALDGLERLATDQATALGRYEGPRLSLAGARDIRVAGLPSQAFLRAAVSSPGTLVLEDAAELDEPIAGILAAGRKHLLIDGIRKLQPQVAAALASARGGVSLDGVASLDRESTRNLLTYAGAHLSLRGLRRAACRIDDLHTAGSAGSPKELANVLAASPPAVSDDVTAIDAVLRSPGTFRLEPAEGDANRQLDGTTAAMLTRGEKHLDLDAFSTIAPDAFKELCQSPGLTSMSGLREIPDGCLNDVCSHTCERLYLDGIGDLDQKQITDLATLIENDRISLTGAGIHNIRELRMDAKTKEKELRRLDGDSLQQFLDRSGPDAWIGTTRGDTFRAMVRFLSRDKVVFCNADGTEAFTRDRNTLSKNSMNKLDKLAEVASKVAEARKTLLFTEPEADAPPGERQ